jgi:polyisoprenoid-binding protein YceI
MTIMKTLTLAILSTAVFAASCADPAANKPKATTAPSSNAAANSTANTATAPAPAATDVFAGFKAAGTELTFGPETSKIEFTGSKVTGKHDGGFKAFKGAIDLVGDKAETSKVIFEVDMKSVFSDADGLTKHLQTGDFFEVEKYPKASFASTKIAPEAGKTDAFTVTGDLEMRGVKKSITFPATIKVANGTADVKSEFSINRKDFGIVYAGKADDLIRDDVVIRLDIKGAKK